jgi:ribose transport system ATP-binding protein
MGHSHNPVLRIEGIHKEFPGTKALTDVSIDFYAGEVHTIMGENGAGKSTLMNILSGVFPPTEGKIYLEGQPITLQNPRHARDMGISIVHQELSLCPHLTVSENMFIGRLPKTSRGLIDRKKLFQETRDRLKLFHSDIHPDDIVGELSVSQQQIIEISKALTSHCKVLILDEPTSAMTEQEAAHLFDIIADLKKQGIAILYISHKFKEIFEISNKISILRDGHFIGTYPRKDLLPDQVVNLMVGRDIKQIYPEKNPDIGPTIFRVENATKKGVFHQIHFQLHQGEVLGIFGLMGAGRTELARSLCGIDEMDSGQIWIEQEKVKLKTVNDAIQKGLVYLSEDRKTEGLFMDRSIKQNIVAANLKAIADRVFVNAAKEEKLAQSFSSLLKVRYSHLDQKIHGLSGGNQQKVMIAKWLSLSPKIMIMDEPTRGIDVGAKAEIYQLLRSFANEGKGVIVISSELPEIIGVCDRILVMHQGEILGELTENQMTEEEIMKYASGIV